MLLGLRPEWMRITSRLYGLDSVVTTDYWMAYPTLHVSYAIDDRRELRLNYSLRVNRPEADALNPFPEYQNPLTLRVGNPYLKPEKIHSVEAGYQWKKGGTTILGTLYYRYVTNKLTPVTRYLANNVLLTTKENLNNGSSAGAELVLDAEIGKWATLDLSGNLFYDQIDATRLGYGNRKDAVAWSASLNANFSRSRTLCCKSTAVTCPPRCWRRAGARARFPRTSAPSMRFPARACRSRPRFPTCSTPSRGSTPSTRPNYASVWSKK